MYQYLWIGASLIIGVLAGGLPLWFIPYSELSLTGPGFVLRWVLAGVIAAGIVGRFSDLSRVNIGLLTACGFVIAVLIRVMVEVVSDQSTHSYWPFEVVQTIMIATPAGLLGAYLGRLLKQRFQEQAQKESDT